jgi:hypothetical protein
MNNNIKKITLALGYVPSLILGVWFGSELSLSVTNRLPTYLSPSMLTEYSKIQSYIGLGSLISSICIVIILGRIFFKKILLVRKEASTVNILGYLGTAMLIGIFSGMGYVSFIVYFTTRIRV